MKQTHRISGHQSDLKGGESGSILVFLIILMVIFTALGVAMVSMFGTSTLSAFASNNARRAAYLSESGIRYTVSEVRNASGSAKETALTNIDDGSINGIWFNVFPGLSRYRVRVYPYWSKTVAGTGVAVSSISATVPNSGFPPGYAIPTAPGGGSVARLQVGPNNPVAISSVTGATEGSTAVTYTLASSVTIPTGVAAYAKLALPTINSSQNITKGSTATPLVLNINSASAVPEKNGSFMDFASGRFFSYQTATLAGSNVQLENIDWSGGAASTTFPAGSYLVFTQAVRIDSTGEHLQTQKTQTDYLAMYSSTSSMGGPPQNYRPPALTDAESGFSNTLGALDLSKSGNRVVVQGYIATGGTHSYWAAFQHLGEAGYSFEDPEESGRYIGWHVAPISNDISDNFRNSWIQYHNLSYDVQIKNGWDLNKDSGGSGIAVRWHESPLFEGVTPPGNDPYRYYQGYGITFMLYKDDNHGSVDMIPNTIKPPGASLNRKLLLILWEQKVDASGVPKKDWLAYALLGDPKNYWNPQTKGERIDPDPDQKVTGYQAWPDGRVNDNATIVVRVEDKFVTTGGVTTRVNDIKLFYGDAAEYTFVNDSRTKDSIAINKERARYYPKWLEAGHGGTLAPINPQWPSNNFGLSGSTITNWFNNLTSYDYFSLTNTTPLAPFNSDGNGVVLIKNTSPRPGFSAVNLLADKCTIRTTDFPLDSFKIGRKEIGLVGMGAITGPNYTVAFDDFYIQILGGY
jgi:Tfp pilus assembly protein PilX